MRNKNESKTEYEGSTTSKREEEEEEKVVSDKSKWYLFEQCGSY